jgi:hypothetical protein
MPSRSALSSLLSVLERHAPAAFAAALMAVAGAGCTTGDQEDVSDPGYYDGPAGGPESEVKPERKPDGYVSIEAKDVGAAGRMIKERAAKLGGTLVEEEVDTTVVDESKAGKRRREPTSLTYQLELGAKDALAFTGWLDKTFTVTRSRVRTGAKAGSALIQVYVYAASDREPPSRATLRIGARWVGLATAPEDGLGGFRHGTGFVAMAPTHQEVALTADVFERRDDEPQPVLVTLGFAGYSTFLGSG